MMCDDTMKNVNISIEITLLTIKLLSFQRTKEFHSRIKSKSSSTHIHIYIYAHIQAKDSYYNRLVKSFRKRKRISVQKQRTMVRKEK